jgi:hypothetical protein
MSNPSLPPLKHKSPEWARRVRILDFPSDDFWLDPFAPYQGFLHFRFVHDQEFRTGMG